MLSDHLTSYTLERYEARRPLLASVADAADAAITACADVDEATLLRYLYATLPITDCIDVAPEVLASYARHAAFLRREVAWAQSLGEGMFVHYVLCPRINNEPLTDCRHTFWDALRERVGGLAPYDAVREVNYWCCEMATYQLTDDRTQSPLSVLASGSGRCGEESTFLVTALRSIGIPARQVYATWWAHCDDNHAWVEAYTGDGWHYLGACEPEEESTAAGSPTPPAAPPWRRPGSFRITATTPCPSPTPAAWAAPACWTSRPPTPSPSSCAFA